VRTQPDTQFSLRPGIVEFRWGHPALDLLPVDGLRRAAHAALDRDGPLALSYGPERGPACLIEQLQARWERQQSTSLSPEQIMITGSTSQGLDMLCTLLTRPGDVALVESPTYHLALRILRDHQLELVPIPADDGGLQVDVLAEVLTALERRKRRVSLLYLVPTYNNPTGVTMGVERRTALTGLAQREGLLILEDDPYSELWYDNPPPPSLYSLSPAGPVVHLGTFSKVLAPGLRLGWMLAAPEIVHRCTSSGMLESGGGVNHLMAHVAAAFIELGLLDRQVDLLRSTYRQRRDRLLDGLARHLPEGCHCIRPGGGFFVWLRLPPGVNSDALLPIAEAAGVSYVPGTRFCAAGGGEQHCRLGFTFLRLPDLEEGARRLGNALHGRQAG